MTRRDSGLVAALAVIGMVLIAMAANLAAPRSASIAMPATDTGVPVSGNPSTRIPALWVPDATSSPVVPAAGGDVRGWATWYRADGMIGAAGPDLRRWLGKGWRGEQVQVCAGSCVTVTLSDWCTCGDRHRRPTLLDLSDDAFRELAPLSQGIVSVTVTRADGPQPTPPATDR